MDRFRSRTPVPTTLYSAKLSELKFLHELVFWTRPSVRVGKDQEDFLNQMTIHLHAKRMLRRFEKEAGISRRKSKEVAARHLGGMAQMDKSVMAQAALSMAWRVEPYNVFWDV